MNSLLDKLPSYVKSLGFEMGAAFPESIGEKVPMFVSAPYEAFRSEVLGTERLLMVAKHEILPTPAQIVSQARILSEHCALPPLFIFPDGSKEFCRSLIQAKLPFIIPDKQFFIPESAIFIREDKFLRKPLKIKTFFSPWAQVFLLYHLLHKENGNELPFQVLLSGLGANKVYISRNAKELEKFGVAEIAASGRNKRLVFSSDRRSIWENALEYMTSPVFQKVRIERIPSDFLLAGISALSEYSNLNDDPDRTFAVYGRHFVDKEENCLEFQGTYVELWKYDPKLLAGDNGCVDKLSLYLSLKDNPDPRVNGELNDMMEAIEW